MVLIFALEWHHCGCYAPTICPSLTTSNCSLLCISETNCTLTVHVPGIFASTCLTPALELLLLNVGAYMLGSRLKDEHLVGFTPPNQTQFWISRKAIIYFSMATLLEWNISVKMTAANLLWTKIYYNFRNLFKRKFYNFETNRLQFKIILKSLNSLTFASLIQNQMNDWIYKIVVT